MKIVGCDLHTRYQQIAAAGVGFHGRRPLGIFSQKIRKRPVCPRVFRPGSVAAHFSGSRREVAHTSSKLPPGKAA
jgi:hypothetical protein